MMKKYYTIYSIEFLGNTLELNIETVEIDIERVYNWIETRNFEINRELESELYKDFLSVVKKDGTRVPNKNYKVNHLNYKYLVISEYAKEE